MNPRRLAQRVTGILVRPRTEWPLIAGEPASISSLYTGYILILAAIPAICGLTVTRDVPAGRAIATALAGYAVSLAMVFVTALVIDGLAGSFGAQKSRVQALKAAAYAYTASWVAGVGVLIPGISALIAFAGMIYAIYLLYLGLPETMKVPVPRAGAYTASIVVAVIAIGVIIALVTGGIFGGTLWATGGGTRASRDAPNVSRLLASVLGGADIKPVAPERLEEFAPGNLGGMARTAMRSERDGALGFQVSQMKATYGPEAGRELRLQIVDTGSVSGFMAVADWADVNEEKDGPDGRDYERTVREDGRIVHREWRESDQHAEYAVILARRFVVAAAGEQVTMQDLESAVQSLDLAALEALRGEDVRKD